MDVIRANHTQLQVAIVATDDAREGHPVAFNQTRNGRNAVDVEAVSVLGEDCVAAGVDGTYDGGFNRYTGRLHHVETVEVAVDFTNSLNSRLGQDVAS